MSVVAFLIAVAYWPGWLGAATVPRETVLLLGVPLVCRLDPRNLWPQAGWLLLFGFAWAIGGSHSIQAGVMLAALCVAFMGSAGLKDLDGPMTGMALGVAVSAVIAVLQFAGFTGIAEAPGAGPGGLFYNREIMAEFAALVFVWLMLSAQGGFLRGALIGTVAVSLLLSESRVAYVAIVAGLLYAWDAPRWIKAVALSWVALLIWVLTLPDPSKLASAYERLRIWRAALASVTPFGHGLGWYGQTFLLQQTAHSDAIQMLVELGLGAVLFMAIPALILIKKRGTNVERAVLVAGCVEAALSFPLQTPATGFAVVVLAGFLAGRGREVRGRSYVGREGNSDLLFPAITARRSVSAHRNGSEVVSFRP